MQGMVRRRWRLMWTEGDAVAAAFVAAVDGGGTVQAVPPT